MQRSGAYPQRWRARIRTRLIEVPVVDDDAPTTRPAEPAPAADAPQKPKPKSKGGKR